MSRRRPKPLFLAIGLVLLIGFTIGGIILELPLLGSYLIAVNLTTFLLYGYDKTVAGKGPMRVPEVILHTFAILGGTPLAFVAQYVLRHKTVKGSFRTWFWLILIGQLAAIGAWLYYYR